MTATTATLTDQKIIDMLTSSYQERLLVEKRSQNHLKDYSQYLPTEYPLLYRHDVENNDFVLISGNDLDEIGSMGHTYETWKDMTLEDIAEATGSTLTSIEEIWEGYDWTLFHLH